MATTKLATTVLHYDEDDFETYEVQLLALCCKDDGSNLELLHDETEEDEDLPMDPITQFYESFKADVDAAIADDDDVEEMWTRFQILQDPLNVEREFAALVTDVATEDDREALQEDWESWKTKEMYIFKKVMATLTGHPSLVKAVPFGAGRALIHHLRAVNKLNETEEDTDTLLDALAQFEILDGEKLRVYKQRLEKLSTQLARAKPEPQPVTVKKLKRVYMQGLSRLPEYAEVIRVNKNKRLNIIHNECKKVEGIIAKRIAKMHKREPGTATVATAATTSSTAATIAAADASSATGSQPKPDNQVREDCRFFVKNGWCRKGTKCKRYHPPGYGRDQQNRGGGRGRGYGRGRGGGQRIHPNLAGRRQRQRP